MTRYIYIGHYPVKRGIVKIGETTNLSKRKRDIARENGCEFVFDYVYAIDTDKAGALLVESIVRYAIARNTNAQHIGNDHFMRANRSECQKLFHKAVKTAESDYNMEISRLI